MSFELFDKAERLERDGQREEALSAYSDFINQHGREQGLLEAEKADDTTAALREKLSLAYNNRGLLYYMKVEFKQAVTDYSQALSLDPGMAVAHYNRGLVHYRLSRFTEAVADLKKAVALNPELEPAKQCLQQSLQDLQRTDIDRS